MRPNKLNTRRRNLSISDADYAKLQQLGGRNASEGVRVALRYANANRIGEEPQNHSVADWDTTKQEREG